MMKSLILIFLISVLTFCSKSQGIYTNAVNGPSTNNAFSGANGMSNATNKSRVDVDLYTGTLMVDVPLFNLASKEYPISTSLAYVGSRGIRVQDFAGVSGLGWQLNAGGMVTRVVRGFPDEQANGYLGTGSQPAGAIGTGGQWGKVVSNNYSGVSPWTAAQYQALSGFSATGSPGLPTADGEPDLYYIKTPSFSFQFTFDQNGKVTVPNETGIKITAINFYNFDFGFYPATNSSFIATDALGNRYFFGTSPASIEKQTQKIFGTSVTCPTTWYLDKIITYNNGDVINFNYLNFFSGDILTHYQSSTTFDQLGHLDNDTASAQITIIEPKFISSITSSIGELDFYYATDRRDDPNSPRLSYIRLMGYNGHDAASTTQLQRLDFTYSYFGDNVGATQDALRLKLDYISISGTTTSTALPLKRNTFTYNTTVNLPSRKSLGAVDYWGYNSYTTNSNPYFVSIDANETNAQANILSSVTGIEGDSYNFTYELNDYYNSATAANVKIGGLRPKSISRTLATGESLVTNYIYSNFQNSTQSSGQILSPNYNINMISGACGSLTKTFSEAPSNFNDINGNFVGYSNVKVVEPNGGYTTWKYSNFSDNASDQFNVGIGGTFLLNTSSVSFAHRRGLLLNKTLYTSSNQKVSEDDMPLTSYAAVTAESKAAWGYHWANYVLYVAGGGSCSIAPTSYYWSEIENYKLTSFVHKEYDWKNPANSVQINTVYTYSSVNNRLYKTISTTDSKGGLSNTTYYYPDETSIPLVTVQEQIALDAMKNMNRINLPVHIVTNKSGSITEAHNTFISGALNNNNGYLNTNVGSKTFYATNNGIQIQTKQELYNWDLSNNTLISTANYSGSQSSSGGARMESRIYGYNSSVLVARVQNASRSVTYTSSPNAQSSSISIPAASNGSKSIYFTTYYAGAITISMPPGTYLSGSVTCFFSFSLNGPNGAVGTLCNSSTPGYTCSSGNSYTYSNMPAGDYALVITPYTNTAASPVPVNVSYVGRSVSTTTVNESFYEGFEENPSSTSGTAHSGLMYWSGNYTTSYAPPNGKQYTIQYWTFSGSKWLFNEGTYTQGMVLTGPVDDIRIFPSDALMTSYTFSPQVGATSETNEAGKATIYQYDGLSRLQSVRDQDNNILRYYDYKYQRLVRPVGNQAQSGSFVKSNCPSGYTGGTFVYTVPANTYQSYVDVPDANSQAITDVNTNGQAYADAQPVATACTLSTVTINCINSVGQAGYIVKFTNTSTGSVYQVRLPSTQASISMPAGTYNLTVSKVAGMSGNIIATFCSNSATSSGTQTSVTINGLAVSPTGCLTLYVNSNI